MTQSVDQQSSQCKPWLLSVPKDTLVKWCSMWALRDPLNTSSVTYPEPWKLAIKVFSHGSGATGWGIVALEPDWILCFWVQQTGKYFRIQHLSTTVTCVSKEECASNFHIPHYNSKFLEHTDSSDEGKMFQICLMSAKVSQLKQAKLAACLLGKLPNTFFFFFRYILHVYIWMFFKPCFGC